MVRTLRIRVMAPPQPEQESCLAHSEGTHSFTNAEGGAFGEGPSALDTRSPSGAALVGRQAEWAALREAFDASRHGKPVMAVVQGDSGIGKSFLIRCFLREIQREHPEAVVLAGRCYEQGSVPYKALDCLVEPLVRRLMSLPGPERAGLLPPQLPYLARLFPVLRPLREIAPDPAPTEVPDPQEFRRRAFGALRGLLCALGNRGPLVLFIDDLQWGDRDSAAQLARLFQPPEPPSMLLLASDRTEEGKVSMMLQDFRSFLSGANAEAVHLYLKELAGPEALSLARARLGPGFPQAEDRSAWIARESGGNPFFITELCQHPPFALAFPGDRGPLDSSRPLAQDPFIHARVEGLPEEGRRLLEALSLAGQPVDGEVLARACGLGQPPAERLTQLLAARFIRIRGEGRNLVETSHDRIRECLARSIPIPRAREIHRALARSLESSPRPDPQALAFHFQHAEEMDKASTYAEQAAEQATEALAFEAAARLFRQALDLCPHQPGDRAGDRARLLVKLGDALANAGLDAEAAGIYQEASGLFSGHEAIRLRRLAAEHFFRCGRFDQGMAILEAVLATLGMKMPIRPWLALVSLLIRRSLIRMRGLGSRLRQASEIAPEELDRIDICWAGAMGLGPIDHIRGGAFQARGLALALRAGEPFRMVRALAHETIYVAHRGSRSQAATQRVLAATQALAEQLGEPGPLGRALIAAGTAGIMQGRWKAAMELHEQAEAILRDHCSGMDYELHISQHHGLASHWILGNVREVAARLPVAIQTAWDKADLLALTNLRTSIAPYLCLARDEPDLARWEVRQAMEQWSSAGFHLQHYNALAALANIHLYEGEPLTAWDLLTTQWAGLRGSLLLRVQPILITMLELRARTALAVVLLVLDPGSRAGTPWLKTARADIRALERENTPYGDALALKLQALEALVEVRTEEAARLLALAETAFGACDMSLHAMAVRQIRSSLEGGPGSARTAEAIADMRNQGVVHPERFARMHVPC